jgi:thymidine kinase
MGYLKIIIGPMYSKKTSMLIDIYNDKKYIKQGYQSYIINQDELLAINYDKDTRYGINKIVSHDKKEIDCISINNFDELLHNLEDKKKLESSKYIFINEAQFFPNLKSWILNQIEVNNKHIILCGLDSDYKRGKFGEILDLVPHADSLIKLYGNCANKDCVQNSLYTHRLTKEKEQEVIGTDNYIPVCRECYNKLNSNNSDNNIYSNM